MVLADLGADVIRVDRTEATTGRTGLDSRFDLLNRGKQSIAVDLKHHSGVEIVLRLVEAGDALIEGFRPGVAEKLGLGPEVCLGVKPGLVYGRMTGWGQTGPLASTAGHDIDYIALSGALAAIGLPEDPQVPLNLVGDFGGGGMMLALGVVSALLAVAGGSRGQVVDAAMVDGSALLMTSHHGYLAEGWWTARRTANLLDGAAPFYTTYRTSDDRHMAVGALEPQFYAELLSVLGIDPGDLPPQDDREGWPEIRSALAAVFATRTRDDWAMAFSATDACVAPVLDMTEASGHPHAVSRGGFVELAGVTQPAPAPRFSATPATVDRPPPHPGEHTDWVLETLGYSQEDVGMLRASGAVA
jgi:alpha-methylacyl-CoA racemase